MEIAFGAMAWQSGEKPNQWSSINMMMNAYSTRKQNPSAKLLPASVSAALAMSAMLFSPASAQSKFEAPLCEAAKTGRTVELVYDKDKSKGCKPRLVDVHQVAVGNNGLFYMHGWQKRGCTKGRDYESERIFRFDKIKSVKIIDGTFGEKSQTVKAEGWDGCIGANCFIEKTVCE